MSRWFATYGFEQVYPGLIVGAYPLDGMDVDTLRMMKIERLLNLVEDAEYRPGDREEVEGALAAAGIAETRMALVDFGHLPAEQIEAAVTIVVGWMGQERRGYVHCRAGWQRSAAIAAGAVAVFEQIDIEDALDHVQARKPTANPLPHQREDLADWWRRRGSSPAA